MSTISPLPPPLPRRSLGEQVYDSIRESIVSLRLEPGSMIFENELAETLGVSRTPIREAIRLLVSEQLVEVLPQRGTRIALISERKVCETRFIREHLELGAFRVSARIWDAGKHQPVRRAALDLLEKQRAASAAVDIALFLQLDEAFHRTILELTGNETLLHVVYHMRGHLNRLRYLVLKQFHRMDGIVEEHEGLLEAIEQGDEELTAERLVRHVVKLDEELPELRRAYPHYFAD